MSFKPNYKHFEDVVKNIRPARLPLYEHIISTEIMEKFGTMDFLGGVCQYSI